MSDPSIPRYVAIEGPIGVGKSSLARILASHFGARLLLEAEGENPFLERFYEDPHKYAFQTQITFLLSRWQQQKEQAQPDLFEQRLVADYILAKDKIFALVNLDNDEVKLYELIYRLLSPQVPKPDLVIYLQAHPEVLLKRIRKRASRVERNISLDYLKTLSNAYNEFFFHYNETPLLVVNTSEIDFVAQPRDLEHLVREVRNAKRGTTHYIPLGSG